MGRPKRAVSGWVILDKPHGMTSTQAVAKVRWLYGAAKAGHAGTLDPLATGLLPIALGEATKTVAIVQGGGKRYRFDLTWGAATSTDDAEGPVIATSDVRPSEADVRAMLPRFTGTIMQRPPAFSAIKVDGERAYDLARAGEVVELAERPVTIDELMLLTHSAERSSFEMACEKGTYVRSLARDLAEALGTRGHVTALRRTAVGGFAEKTMILLEDLEALCQKAASGEASLADALMPVETALDDIPALAVSRVDAARLTRGQAVLLRGRDAPNFRGTVYVTVSGQLLALAELDRGEIVPKRVFNLAGLIGSASVKKG